MEMANLKTLWKIAKKSNVPLFGTIEQLAGLNFMNGYLADFAKFDRNTAVNVGFLEPIWNRNEEDSDEAVLSQFQEDASIVLFKNKKNLERLYELTLIDYKPLENYSMVEAGTDKTEGSNNVTSNYGEQSKTNTNGAQNETVNRGARTYADVEAAVTDTEAVGAKTSTTEDKVSAYDKVDYQNSDLSETAEGEQSNTNQYGERNTTHTENAYEDVTRRDAVTNTESINAHIDSESSIESRNTTHNFTRSGNVGVTTSQQMAQSEIDLWSSFKFFDIIVNIIVKELCTYRDEQEPMFYL